MFTNRIDFIHLRWLTRLGLLMRPDNSFFSFFFFLLDSGRNTFKSTCSRYSSDLYILRCLSGRHTFKSTCCRDSSDLHSSKSWGVLDEN